MRAAFVLIGCRVQGNFSGMIGNELCPRLAELPFPVMESENVMREVKRSDRLWGFYLGFVYVGLGANLVQVIADFDATLTKYWIDGRRGQSSHGLLQQGNPEYDAKRQKLYEYYHPLEFNPRIPVGEKTKLMEEWWGKTHALLIEGGLTYDAIKNSVATSFIAFRDGVVELFEFLEERNVPVLIFSAGLADIIEEVLRQKLHRSFKNVKIVSNRMVFDQNGHLVSFKGKTIHSLNKNEHALDMAAPVHDHLGEDDLPIDESALVKKRTNVLLLGDHLGDLGMSDGLIYERRISVGFL
ncbi:hypothetical protein RJ640_001331 [Escallonia rubra]|uniref:5'-nucleotidase n=1 Tax=Escallonia rubra TaxID=112253 RepID=A0AA88R769_9ASTE|nr:hypothetical protein RJ640_001331 [Escallonia rubra]